MSSLTLHVIQRSSVTRATAANLMPVKRHTTSRMVGTAPISCTAAMSVWNSAAAGRMRSAFPLSRSATTSKVKSV